LRLALALDDPKASFPPGSLWPNVPGSPTSPGRVNAFSRSQLKATALPLLDIVIENIVTGYLQPWSAPPILDGVAAVIPAGSVIGIVGETGSGKTTLLKTLIGMLPPWDGDIVIGSHKLEDVVQRWWNSICLIPQHGHLFARTIRENICYGLSNVPQDKVEAAAKKAMAHDFITKKEKGYDHILAPGGTDLSGGQRQRIHLARAFLRKSRYLFLDEPTSALDNATQDQIIANLNELLHLQQGEKRSRTCVVVTHRTEVLSLCDQVLHMYEGRITKVEARNKQPAPGSFPMPVTTAFPNETSPKRQDNANEMMPVVMLPDWEHHNVDTGLHSNGTSSTIQADYGAGSTPHPPNMCVLTPFSCASCRVGSVVGVGLQPRAAAVERRPNPVAGPINAILIAPF